MPKLLDPAMPEAPFCTFLLREPELFSVVNLSRDCHLCCRVLTFWELTEPQGGREWGWGALPAVVYIPPHCQVCFEAEYPFHSQTSENMFFIIS